MKIAKRVLAVVMAIAMIAGLSAMAFAASGTFNLVAGAVNNGTVTVTLYAANCKGLESADVIMSYDASKLTFEKASLGADAGKLSADGNFMGAANGADGTLKYSLLFLESMDESITNFEVAVFTFKVADGVTEATVAITDTGVDGIVAGSAATIKVSVPDDNKGEDENKTPDTDKKDNDKKTEDPSKSPVKPGKDCKPGKVAPKDKAPKKGNKNTGDNMALAAAGAVVVLAGAAFVISKKKRG